MPADIPLRDKSPKSLRSAFGAVDSLLVRAGATRYVKTIYIGYLLGDDLVAAMYPMDARLEIAVAVPAETCSPLLIDATHLTWPTMPVAIVLESKDDLPECLRILDVAVQTVRSGSINVRPTEVFRDRERKGRGHNAVRRQGPSRPRS